MKKKVVVTGGTGRFGNILKSFKSRYKVFFPTKKDLDILYEKKIPLMITSRINLESIDSSKSLVGPFKRTVSRLYELTSINYD